MEAFRDGRNEENKCTVRRGRLTGRKTYTKNKSCTTTLSERHAAIDRWRSISARIGRAISRVDDPAMLIFCKYSTVAMRYIANRPGAA